MTKNTPPTEDTLSEAQSTMFQELLNEEMLTELFKKHGLDLDKSRKRKLPFIALFWLMLLSAANPSARGSLSKLTAQLLASIALLPWGGKAEQEGEEKLSKSAVSQRLCLMPWAIYRNVYNGLLLRYQTLLPQRKLLGQFRDIKGIDSSSIRLFCELEQWFKSSHQGIAALKIHTRFSFKLGTAERIQVTKAKQHDSKFKGVTQALGLLYLMDLGYWSFSRLARIHQAGSYFVMKLKTSCDPVIVEAPELLQDWVGKTLAEVQDKLTEFAGDIDLQVQLSKNAKTTLPEFRLVALWHEDQYYFYVTNLNSDVFSPQHIYKLYALRWEIEVFFNQIKNVMNLQNIISRNKNGIMIEIYSALIYFLLSQVVIALAAPKQGLSVLDYSVEKAAIYLGNFFSIHLHLLLKNALQAFERIWQKLIAVVALQAKRETPHPLLLLENEFAQKVLI